MFACVHRPTTDSIAFLIRVLPVILLMISGTTVSLHAQSWMPVIRDEVGDTIRYTYPPDPSTYVPDELIIKFRKGTLNYDYLCYDPDTRPETRDGEKGRSKIMGIDPAFRSYLMGQRFHVDSGIIASVPVREIIKALGGTHLRRITYANPCTDTISIARNGDTLTSDDFNWMLLELGNDTSVVTLGVMLTVLHQNGVELAEPNYYLQAHATPSDSEYVANKQFSLGMIQMEDVWNQQTGSYAVRVGVIDDGLDYNHCDLGPGKGPNMKVSGGWSYSENDSSFRINSEHGTPVTGIIGAYTNGTGCVTFSSTGIAGIGGGWRGDSSGLQIRGFRVEEPGTSNYNSAHAIAAIRDAVARNPSPRGDSVHILNISWGTFTFSPANYAPYYESLRSAVGYAYEHGVSFVASRGNFGFYGTVGQVWPACYESAWVTSVGASRWNKTRFPLSNFAYRMDLLAPGGDARDTLDGGVPNPDQIVRTTQYNGGYRWFDQTSAAAPHVSGVIGLLRSEALSRNWTHLEPDDYEGMLKASAEDITPVYGVTPGGPAYTTGWDEQSGWGFLRADSIFTMLTEGYRVTHYDVGTNINDSIGWGDIMKYQFVAGGRRKPDTVGGSYSVRRREIIVKYGLPKNRWDLSRQLYVWGRGGSSGGFSGSNPNYQIPWTEVRSGLGGRNDDTVAQVGIWHNHSDTVIARTFQYEVLNDSNQRIKLLPATSDIRLRFSVFGLEIPASVRQAVALPRGVEIAVSPNPAKEKMSVRYAIAGSATVYVQVLDALGSEVIRTVPEHLEQGTYGLELDVTGMESGVYYCRVIVDGKSYTASVAIVR